jgi:hypothetical protein
MKETKRERSKMSQDSQDSQKHVPAAVQVLGDYKLLVKILSWISAIPGFPKGTRGPLLIRLGGTCRGVRRAAATLVDQRTIERIVALMPTWQWVDFSAAYGPADPDPMVDSSGQKNRPSLAACEP